MSEIKDVQRFHRKFQLPDGTNKNLLFGDSDRAKELREYRINFILEEFNELRTALDNGKEVDAFDAMLDICYVVYGTALYMGITPETWIRGFAEVQRCNMKKERAACKKDSKRGTAFDVVKPKGWTGPEAKLEKLITHSLLVKALNPYPGD